MFLLQPNQVDIWFVDLEQQFIPINHCYAVLNEKERVQSARFKFPLLTQRYIETHALLRFLLACYLNTLPQSIQFETSTHGKPYLLNYSHLHFNISHSNSQLIIAIAQDFAVGVDIEHIKLRKTLEDLVLRCFGLAEQTYWFSLDDNQKVIAFYQFWTRKEAFVKATGLGIALGLEQCVINPLNSRYFLTIPSQCGFIHEWQLQDLSIADNYCAAVVANTVNGIKILQRELSYDLFN